ncbi:MAG TPA: (Fe-S)-binding protein [Solirubrobacteraceae bacterium]
MKTRPVFWHFTVGLKITWYALAVLSVLVFVYGVARPLYKWSRGRGGPSPPYPWRELPGKLWRGLGTTLSHATIARRDGLAGWAHGAIFYGWIILFAGTIVLGFDTDFTKPVFGWDYFHGNFYLGYKEVLNVLGTVLIAGVLVMMFRRGVLRPRKLDYARPDRAPGEAQFERRTYRVGDWAFVSILLVIALTGFVLEGVRIAMSHPGYGGTQFGGWIVAQAFGGTSEATLAGLRHGLWWFHGLLAITFVASIPYTKAAHMITSYLSLSLRDPLAGKRLAVIPPERSSEPAGYGKLEDFSPLHLLQLDACTKCGRCHAACPANATGRPLSPRDVVLELHEQSNVALGGVLGALMTGRLDGGARPDGDGTPDGDASTSDGGVIGHDGVRTETVWSCMQCNACVEACPVGIQQAPIINQLRRRLVEEGDLDANLQSVLQTVHKSGNSFGERNRRRGRWTEELDFDVKDARREPVEVLWFVGDYASFDPRSQRVSRTLARLLQAAGVDFGILYDGERNSGNDVRRIGEEGLFESLAEQNIATISECEFERIMTTDPHSLNTLRNEYPQLGSDWQVLHHTELLLELIRTGSLDVGGRLSYRATYHDPCYLGRHNGVYEAPRQILRELGCALIEMPRNRSNSFCCGAGGGRIWIPDQPGQERPSENRIREAVALPDVELFVVCCPKDVTMFEDAIKTSGNAERIELRELTELVDEALLPQEVVAAT